MLWGRRRGDGTIVAVANRWSAPMPQPNDLSRSLVALDQDSTIIAVVEMSQSSWLVAGVLPGIERQSRKKLEPSAERLLGLLLRWRDEAVRAGKKITRIALAFEAGRDGFWLARGLSARGGEAHVIDPSSVAVSREHRRAKTDRLDTELLKRAFLGWLRGERGHCSMARVPRQVSCRTPRSLFGLISFLAYLTVKAHLPVDEFTDRGFDIPRSS